VLPRLREAVLGAVVLADGFSCRTQIHELDSGGREAMHVAELLATAGGLDHDHPERTAAPRHPGRPRPLPWPEPPSPRRPAGRSSALAQPGGAAPVHQESAA
jgi:hypothetical protein